MTDIITILGDQVQIIFEMEHEGLVYRDALYYPQTDYDSMDQSQIDSEKQARFDAWVSIITPVNTEE